MEDHNEFKKLFGNQLIAHGFRQMKTQGSAGISGLFTRAENPVLYLISFYSPEDSEKAQLILTAVSREMEKRLDELRCNNIIVLRILISDAEEVPYPESPYSEKIHFADWHFSPALNSLYVKKGDPKRLLEIEKLLSSAARRKEAIPEATLPYADKKPWGCIVIFALCVLLLGITTLLPYDIIGAFGLSRDGILKGQYYLFFTSIFLHGGLLHLISNGVYLYYFGSRLEAILGRKKFFIIFFVSGFTGGILSVISHNVLAVGASGAIYGLMGAMLVEAKRYGARATGMSYATILLLAAVSICQGFIQPGIDNFAHIGGLIGGILMFLILDVIKAKKR